MTDPALAISNLILRYAELMDLGDFAGVGEPPRNVPIVRKVVSARHFW